MENFKTQISKFKDFKYHGIYCYAYNNGDRIIKGSYQPKEDKYKNIDKYLEPVFNFHTGEKIKPNGIQINATNISTIDVDKPDECDILEQLLNDCKFYVKTKKGYHFYFKKEDELERNKQCEIIDVNMDKLWYVPAYYYIDIDYEKNEKGEYILEESTNGKKYKITNKYDINDKPYGGYKLIKSEELVDMPKYAKDYCKILIKLNSTKKEKETNNKIISNVEKLIINPDIKIEKFNLDVMKTILKVFYENKFFEKYQDWRDVGYMCRHLNNTEEAFKLFDKYSRKVDKYKNVPEYNNRVCFYGNSQYNENFNPNGVLSKIALLNPEIYKKDLQFLKRTKYEKQIIKFNHQYIYNDKTEHIFKDWIKNYKALCIKSAYGTGKTFTFKKLIDINNFERVLFITYRQSLAHSLSLELKDKYKFDNYLDGDIKHSKRIIIQLDSIKRLLENVNLMTQKDGIPKYELIVLDESEGLLNHLSFEKIDQFLIHSILTRLLAKANKVLVLDGDMNSRTYDFITTLNIDYKLYANEYKPNKKHFIFGYDIDNFDKKVDDDLKAGKKLVIVCMTRTESEKYNDKYKKTYKVILHNSIEKNKEILKKVNEEWAKCDLLIYSPTVESGVDFNIVGYFDKCYTTISNASTSYRAFFQMLNRIRDYKDNNINVLIPHNILWNPLAILVDYDEMKTHKWQNIEINNLTNILIHNDVEKFNSKKYLIPAIIQTLKDKGHTFEYLKDRPMKKPKTEQSAIIKNNIINATDIDDDKFEELLNKQQQNMELSRNDSNSLIKHFYKKAFLVDEITEEFFDKHYNKFGMLNNYKLIINNNRKEHLIDHSNYKYEVDSHKDKLYLIDMKIKQVETIEKLLNIFDYKVYENNIIKINKDKIVHYNDIVKNILEIINNKDFKFLFNSDQEVKKNNIMPIVSNLLDNYGIKLTRKRDKQKGDDGEFNNDYEIKEVNFNDIITGYNERKTTIEKLELEEARKRFYEDPFNYGTAFNEEDHKKLKAGKIKWNNEGCEFIDDIIENLENGENRNIIV